MASRTTRIFPKVPAGDNISASRPPTLSPSNAAAHDGTAGEAMAHAAPRHCAGTWLADVSKRINQSSDIKVSRWKTQIRERSKGKSSNWKMNVSTIQSNFMQPSRRKETQPGTIRGIIDRKVGTCGGIRYREARNDCSKREDRLDSRRFRGG